MAATRKYSSQLHSVPHHIKGSIRRTPLEPQYSFCSAAVYVDFGVGVVFDVLVDDADKLLVAIFSLLDTCGGKNRALKLGRVDQKLERLEVCTKETAEGEEGKDACDSCSET